MKSHAQKESERPLRIFICAGEVSGDMHAAALINALREQCKRPLLFRGFGGDAMRHAKAELIYHTDQTAIMGITPVLRNLPFLLRMMRHLKQEIRSWQPDLLLTVDYPGMNLRLAEFAQRRGIKCVHYICPQVWAWHRGRIPKIARTLDMLLCILPFEPALFKETPLRALFTGHPLVDRAAETRAMPAAILPWQGRYHIALLPGSRVSEIERILPRLLVAATLLEERLGYDCSFIIPAPTEKICELSRAIAARLPTRPRHLHFSTGQARAVMLQAHAAAVASGTATLEAALMRCPTVLVYVASRVTYWFARTFITGVKHIGLANIIAGHTIMPELLQDDFTPQRLADQLALYLTNAVAREKILADLDAANALLGAGGASQQAAQAIATLLPSGDITQKPQAPQ